MRKENTLTLCCEFHRKTGHATKQTIDQYTDTENQSKRLQGSFPLDRDKMHIDGKFNKLCMTDCQKDSIFDLEHLLKQPIPMHFEECSAPDNAPCIMPAYGTKKFPSNYHKSLSKTKPPLFRITFKCSAVHYNGVTYLDPSFMHLMRCVLMNFQSLQGQGDSVTSPSPTLPREKTPKAKCDPKCNASHEESEMMETLIMDFYLLYQTLKMHLISQIWNTP